MIKILHTNESVRKLAKKCKTRSSFINEYRSAYNYARKNGILDDICKHMTPSSVVRSNARLYWTYDLCKKEAKKYTNRTDFMRNSSGAYNVALANKWVDKICIHMVLRHKPNGFWTFEKCQRLAKSCETIKEFRDNHSSAYVTSKNRKWLDEICSHIDRKKRKWTLSEIKIEAKKFKTRIEFAKNASGAYTACLNNNWLKYCDRHFIRQVDNREERLQDLILDKLQLIAKRHNFEVTKELKIQINKNKYCRPDFFIKHKENKKFLLIEVKHDDSFWTSSEIKKQIRMYNNVFKDNKKFKHTILVSKEGKYGINMDELNKEIMKRLL
jgi:hypothetical protein